MNKGKGKGTETETVWQTLSPVLIPLSLGLLAIIFSSL